MASSKDSLVIITGSGEECFLPDRFSDILLDALNVTARRKIALSLNVESDLLNEKTNLVSDYTGLAELVGFKYREIQNFERLKSPTEELLKEWSLRLDLNPTLGKLWEYLVQLGRIDVLEDCHQLIIRDAEAYLKIKERQHNDYIPIQSDDVGSTSDAAMDHDVDETLILCRGDVEKGTPQNFDAFICYNPEGEDLKFVRKMIEVLENEPHNLKLFVPWRDDLPGSSRYVIDAKLIESRCRRMVIIMSRNYQSSAACDFQVKFAHALSPGARSKKLIPVLIEPGVDIPQVLRHVTLCDFTKRDLMDWFWDRLSKAIKADLKPSSSFTSLQRSSSSSSSSSAISSGPLTSSPSTASGLDIPLASGFGFNASSHTEVRENLKSLRGTSSSNTVPEKGTNSGPDSGFSSISSGSPSNYVSFNEVVPMETSEPDKNKPVTKRKTGFFDKLRGKSKNSTSTQC